MLVYINVHYLFKSKQNIFILTESQVSSEQCKQSCSLLVYGRQLFKNNSVHRLPV